jgi:CHAT domain-containing protein
MQPVAAALDKVCPPPQSEVDADARLVVLVPTGRLALLPLHAARYRNNDQEHLFLDDFIVAYTPSARVLGGCHEALTSLAHNTPTLFAVSNPLPLPPDFRSLDFAGVETGEVATLFEGRGQLLCETNATRKDVESGMSAATYSHFACHGQFNTSDPLASGLLLSDSQWLTLADLFARSTLKDTRLVVLSACQTAVTDFNNLPEEAVGLPAGFLRAGVPGVIGSLWPINDLSTAPLMKEFYRLHLIERQGIAAALRGAQRWLRGATAQKMALAEYWAQVYQASQGSRRRDAFRAMRFYRANPESCPFEHPYHWAAFTCHGT